MVGIQWVKNKFPHVSTVLLMGVVIMLIYYFEVPNPKIICMIVLVFTTFWGGYSCGIISGMMTLIYNAYFFSDKHSFFQYSNNNLYKMIVIFISLLLMVVMVGMIKQRLSMQTKELEDINQLLYRKTISDELTGLYNYRYFIERLGHVWNKCMMKQMKISLAMIDIDFFKKYNDYYGHQKGNECISKISYMLRTNIQCSDGFVARYGGEEFVIVMPGMDAEEAKSTMENIRMVIEKNEIEHKASELYRYVTISIGIATIIPTSEMTLDTIIKNADYVLYEAKRTGRNRVLIEADVDTRENIRKTDGRFIFPEEQREAYERLILPLGIYQVVEDKVITLLVSDGLCEMTQAGRLQLMEHYDRSMFGNVHPDDREMLAKAGYSFAREEAEYDVTYRTRFFKEEYHKLHVVGRFQTVGEGARVAFLVYTEIKN